MGGPLSDYLMVGDRTRWSVLWLVKKNGRLTIIEKTFENDLSSAMELYLKVKMAGKHKATLRSMNVGFPPPEEYRPRFEKNRIPTGRTKIVKRGGKRYRKKLYRTVETEVIPMEELNLKGTWWCPYCREMRKFQHWDGVKTDGSFFQSVKTSRPMFINHPGMYCPMCGINQNDSHVRRWNPQAALLEFRINTTRRTRGRKTTRQRKSRS